MPRSSPRSTFDPVILEVAASGYIPHLPFRDIGTLGPHDTGCTLKLQLQPHWLVLELLVGYRLGAGNLSELQFGMWLVALPA